MDTSNSPFDAPMNTSARAGAGGIDLMHFVHLLLGHKWKIMFFVSVVTVVTVVMVKPMRSIYQAETTVMIETSHNNYVQLEPFYGGNTQNREYMATQYEIIRSRHLAEKVIDRLNLVRHPEYDPRQQVVEPSLISSLLAKVLGKSQDTQPKPPPVPDEQIDAMVKQRLLRTFKSSLLVIPLYGTHLVKIGFTSNDPVLSAQVANAVADVYIESYLESRLAATKKATNWISERVSELRDNLQESEQRLQDYKEQESLVDVQGVRTLDSAELTQLREDFIDARQARVNAENLYRQVASYEQLNLNQLMAIPIIFNNDSVQRLVEQKNSAQRTVVELSKRYGPKHPKMISALAIQKDIDQDLDAQMRSVSKAIINNYQSNVRNEQNLQGQIDQARDRLQSVSRKEVKLRELEREVETNRQIYDLFLSRGKEADESSRIEQPHASIVDPAVPPPGPIGPNKKKFVIAAFLFSGALSCGLIILLDLLDSTLRTNDDIENKLGMPVLGFLPLVKLAKNQFAFRAFSEEDQFGFMESIRSIRTSLIMSGLEKPFETIVVTSSVQSEGKSTVALNLAEAMGQMEKVLLIDADMRRPALARILGMPSSSLGLSNIISGKVRVNECIHRLPDSNIDVILAGTIPANPLEMLGSKEFNELLRFLNTQYDRVIIDSAPVHVVSDAKVLSSKADTMVYVVKASSTQVRIAKKGLSLLQNVNAPLSGVVLNQVDLNKSSNYDPYYSIYKQQYGYVTSSS